MGWITVKRSEFTLLSGTPQGYGSSPGVMRTFCPRCGTPLTWASEESAEHVDVTTTSLDDPALFPPTREIWLEHAIPWETRNKALGQYPRGVNAGPYPD